MPLISWDTAEFHFEAWFLQGALQTGLACTHAFLPPSARQRVWEGVRLRLPQGRTVATLAQDPLVFSQQLMSSPVLGIFCLKRACFPVTHSRCSQQQHFRFICHVGERGGKN